MAGEYLDEGASRALNQELVTNLSRITTPRDWTFVFGCPSSKWRFTCARARGEFCHSYADWADYQRRLLSPYRGLFPYLARTHGLRILHMPSATQLQRALASASNFVLFAHCDKRTRRVELREGMVSFERLLDCIPRQFAGIADLSVCEPDDLPLLVKARAPQANVRATGSQLTAVGWLHFYAYLFITMAESPRSYAQALLESASRFRSSPGVSSGGAESEEAYG
jgi:hypothetical protein